MTAESLREDYSVTVNKYLSKSETVNWCLSNNYKKETLDDIEQLISNNPNGFPELNLDSPNSEHITIIEKKHGGRAEYMNPISVKHKLYKFMPSEYIFTKGGYIKSEFSGKWFIIQSVGGGKFLKRTDYNSYKIKE